MPEVAKEEIRISDSVAADTEATGPAKIKLVVRQRSDPGFRRGRLGGRWIVIPAYVGISTGCLDTDEVGNDGAMIDSQVDDK